MNFNKKKLRRRLSIFFGLFIIANILLYAIEYKRYVSLAPIQLKEARKDIVNALMFHTYYKFFVKIIRIDFQNPILSPLRESRDYFYHKGINHLSINNAERAIWFDLFEVRLYNYSVNAKYGSMARKYGYAFSENFINKVYQNIQLLSQNEVNDKSTPAINEEILEIYIDLINIYIYDFHLHPDGFLFREKNMDMVSTDLKQFKKFENIYKWQKEFVSSYKLKDNNQYKRVLNPYKGWYSPSKNYFNNVFILSSFILFYKVNNDLFDCKNDYKYIKSQIQSIQFFKKLLTTLPKSSKRQKELSRKVAYLFLPNEFDNKNLHLKERNALHLSINCNYKQKSNLRLKDITKTRNQ